MCDNGLRALVDVHRVDDPETLRFLRGDADPTRTALQRYLDKLNGWHEWCRADLVVGADVLAQALRVLLESAPDTDAETAVWGDARVGNMCFGDDLSVVALFDWETAGTGPPDIDLGWWLMFERFLCEALGFTRLPGVPDDDEIVRRYLQFGGTLTGDIVLLPTAGCVRPIADQQPASPPLGSRWAGRCNSTQLSADLSRADRAVSRPDLTHLFHVVDPS